MADERTLGYARGILAIASAEKQSERVADELFRISRVVEANNELRQSLTDLALPTDAKEKLLDGILGNRVSPHTLNVAKLLIAQGRAKDLTKIANELARLAEEEAKREVAEVRTAIPLDDDQKRKITAALSKATGKNVTVKVIVDPSVIGGVLARVGDVVIDGTIRNKLDSLKTHLGV